MQDALGGKAIHAALRSLTNICSGVIKLWGRDRAFRVRCPHRGPELTSKTVAASSGGLRWRQQLSAKPCVGSDGLHRID